MTLGEAVAELSKIRAGRPRIMAEGNRVSSPKPHGLSAPSVLEQLPVELILEITDYLGPVDRTALALTCHAGLDKLGSDSLRLNANKRRELLMRLERDGFRKPDILCPVCGIFHSARLSLHTGWRLDDGLAQRPCCYDSEARYLYPSSRVVTPYLPRQFHFNTVAAVLRSHRHGWKDYPISVLSSNSEAKLDLIHGGVKMRTSVNAMIVDGRLLAKVEHIILPCSGLVGLRVAASRTSVYLKHNFPRDNCCNHWAWTDIFDRVFAPVPRLGPERRVHRFWDPRPLSELDLRGSLYNFCDVRGCGYCFTDYALGVQDLSDGAGRVLILTTWKDLGAGLSVDDAHWKSHLAQRKRDAVVVREPTELCAIYRAFEVSGPPWPSRANYYSPKLDDATMKAWLS
ncbi:hypothetical protein HIM_06909 [Hirsutella minnesotensis 3608]|uniref:F-box domain-containing protein n=1 Tax=Hirsutella minnesotensis 3608 TaxID=1043627 RepID=A0A0F7ZIJ9_9HYPO|nr:hypothetical protein HIM_06909 [Hirsutella minnesotensis 3608]